MAANASLHLLRHPMSFASDKDRKAVAAALKAVYTAVDAEAAEAAPAEFEDSDLAARHPAIAPGWRRAWTEVVPLCSATLLVKVRDIAGGDFGGSGSWA